MKAGSMPRHAPLSRPSRPLPNRQLVTRREAPAPAAWSAGRTPRPGAARTEAIARALPAPGLPLVDALVTFLLRLLRRSL